MINLRPEARRHGAMATAGSTGRSAGKTTRWPQGGVVCKRLRRPRWIRAQGRCRQAFGNAGPRSIEHDVGAAPPASACGRCPRFLDRSICRTVACLTAPCLSMLDGTVPVKLASTRTRIRESPGQPLARNRDAVFQTPAWSFALIESRVVHAQPRTGCPSNPRDHAAAFNSSH
jgi:hypothetical protein